MKLEKRERREHRGKAPAIIAELKTHIKNGTLKRGIQSRIAEKHGVDRQYVSILLRNILQKK